MQLATTCLDSRMVYEGGLVRLFSSVVLLRSHQAKEALGTPSAQEYAESTP